MRIKCKTNRSKGTSALLLPYDENMPIDYNNLVVSHEGYDETTRGGAHTLERGERGYCLTANKEYTVLGIMIYKGEVRYLILNDDGEGGFFPESLFYISDGSLLFDWSFNQISLHEGHIIFIGDNSVFTGYSDLRDFIDNNNPIIMRRIIEYKKYLEENLL